VTLVLVVGSAALISVLPSILHEPWSPGLVLVWLIVSVLPVVLVGFTRRIWLHLVKLREFRAELDRLPIGEAVVVSVFRSKTLTLGVGLASGKIATLRRFSTAMVPRLGQRIAIIESACGLVEGAWPMPGNQSDPSRRSHTR
jgi:hypothetical protein